MPASAYVASWVGTAERSSIVVGCVKFKKWQAEDYIIAFCVIAFLALILFASSGCRIQKARKVDTVWLTTNTKGETCLFVGAGVVCKVNAKNGRAMEVFALQNRVV